MHHAGYDIFEPFPLCNSLCGKQLPGVRKNCPPWPETPAPAHFRCLGSVPSPSSTPPEWPHLAGQNEATRGGMGGPHRNGVASLCSLPCIWTLLLSGSQTLAVHLSAGGWSFSGFQTALPSWAQFCTTGTRLALQESLLQLHKYSSLLLRPFGLAITSGIAPVLVWFTPVPVISLLGYILVCIQVVCLYCWLLFVW